MTSSNLGHMSTRPPMAQQSRIKKVGTVSLAGSIVFGLMAFSGMTPAVAAEPNVPLGTADSYSVLAGSTVTNTGPSVLNQNLGLTPGSAVTGFPPGIVNGTMEVANGPALQAQSDLTTAYNNAAGRSITATVGADLAGTTLTGGVYKSWNGPLSLTGELTLDGENDPNSVFIFQTDSTLITGAASKITLINSAQACNVYWQVGSSATLGSGSAFAGTVMALTSITAETSATIEGRALARNGAVTLDNNVFTMPGCDMTMPVPTSTATPTATAPVVIPTGTPTATSTASSTPSAPVVIPTTPSMTTTATSPVVTPTSPSMTTTSTITVPTSPSMTTTTTETGGPWTPADSSTPLANTGVTSTSSTFANTAIILLLAGLGLLIFGKRKTVRQH